MQDAAVIPNPNDTMHADVRSALVKGPCLLGMYSFGRVTATATHPTYINASPININNVNRWFMVVFGGFQTRYSLPFLMVCW